ncbi:Outer membrane efflux protein BepC [Nitratireductor thuwali]|uniref:Outer membrane efflux protein BepC n=2 Tax=Nitratireductor thuwali TaxID=2267699 RepID=A0ABY5MTY7_9HYPH|nr:Outer membrane efflux protein BepC [Nitratireductor thuwali]
MSVMRSRFLAALTVSAAIICPIEAHAETIFGALAKAYNNNSSLNSERAGVRVTDEGVAIAKSGMRPRINGSASATLASRGGVEQRTGELGISLQQPIFDGFQTRNNVQAAESGVRAAFSALQNEEVNTLLNAASAYVDVIRDRQIAALRAQNLDFLEEQVRSARSRLEVGEGTRTDLAQAQASRQAALAQLSQARANAAASAALYQQIVGSAPGDLKMPEPLTKLMPSSLDSAVAIALSEHPAIAARLHAVDQTSFQVKSAEGALLPQLNAQAGISTGYTDSNPGLANDGTNNAASIGLNLTVPIYQGGASSARVRQAKEQLGQSRILVDVTRDQVREAVTRAWTGYQAARESVVANRELVSAARLALDGVIEERAVGQRTTLDVLNAQADVINARIDLVTAERAVVAASYGIVAALGRLTAPRLGLQVTVYQPEEHYNAVKDKWYGLRTPDGR